MSIKGKLRRERRDAMQKKQAQLVIRWICGALLLFALIFYIVYVLTQN